MPRSFLDVFGRAEALRIMSKAVAEAAEENQAAGLTTASFIEGQLVVIPGHGATSQEKGVKGPRHCPGGGEGALAGAFPNG